MVPLRCDLSSPRTPSARTGISSFPQSSSLFQPGYGWLFFGEIIADAGLLYFCYILLQFTGWRSTSTVEIHDLLMQHRIERHGAVTMRFIFSKDAHPFQEPATRSALAPFKRPF